MSKSTLNLKVRKFNLRKYDTHIDRMYIKGLIASKRVVVSHEEKTHHPSRETGKGREAVIGKRTVTGPVNMAASTDFVPPLENASIY